jgi:hypothetical protein
VQWTRADNVRIPLRPVTAAVALFVCTAMALADGKVFWRTAAADLSSVPMPDQRALICYDGKVQTLVIESGFRGPTQAAASTSAAPRANPKIEPTATPTPTPTPTPTLGATSDAFPSGGDRPGFAWVVPLPAQAEVSESTKGLFPSLRALFAPRVEQQTYWIFVLPLLPLLLVILLMVRGARSWRWYVAVPFLLLATTLFLLPSLGKARGGAGAAAVPGVTVLSHTRVGAQKITQVTGSGDALKDWLAAHGVGVTPAVSRVVDDYAREGWVFAACTLATPETISAPRNADSADAFATPPLVFRFPTKAPVYPMRLTGADATVPLDVELFVFSSGTASAPGLNTICSAPTLFPSEDQLHRGWPGFLRSVRTEIEVSHSAIAPLAAGMTHATHLRGELKPAEMTQDLSIITLEAATFGRSVWTRQAAAEIALQVGLVALMLALIGVEIAARFRSRTPSLSNRGVLIALGLGLSAGGVVLLATPTLRGGMLGRENRNALSDLLHRLNDSESPSATTLAELSARAREMAATIGRHDAKPKEGDGPGEYRLIRDDGYAAAFVYVDAIGREQRWPLWFALEDE